MIPKIIHYCWFGGKPLPAITLKYIDSWKKYLPDYEIIEWNESNFDINSNNYCKRAYEAKKYAFVSDVARLKALCEIGGIYFDTDVEVVKSLDSFLEHKAFGGFENINSIGTAVLACEKSFPIFQEFFDVYKEGGFVDDKDTDKFFVNVNFLTDICKKYGYVANNLQQNINGFVIYPKEYFSPKYYDIEKIIMTENSATIHHYESSWKTEKEAKRHKKAVFFRNTFGRKLGGKLYLATEIPSKVKEYGFKGLVSRVVRR